MYMCTYIYIYKSCKMRTKVNFGQEYKLLHYKKDCFHVGPVSNVFQSMTYFHLAVSCQFLHSSCAYFVSEDEGEGEETV
jgi:hypothetical protein